MNTRKKTGVRIFKIRYNVNKEKGTTTCIIDYIINKNTLPDPISGGIFGVLMDARKKLLKTNTIKAQIIAKVRCHKDDTFDEEVGKRLAESKAKRMLFNTTKQYWSEVFHTLHTYAREINSLVKANQNAESGEENHFKKLSGE